MKVALERLAARVRLMIGRGVLRLVDDAKAQQMVQLGVMAKETREMERFQDYGFTSVPQEGAEAIVAALAGRRDHLVALRIDDRRFRLKNLKPGEVALYDDLGNVIVFKRDQVQVQAVQHLDVTAPTCHITATTTHDGNVTINGNLVVNGTGAFSQALSSATSVADQNGTMQGMRDTYNAHNHPGDSGGTTGTPNQGMN